MALGRCLFIFFNHALYLIGHAAFGLSAQNAYVVFKYAVVAQGPLTVIACWVLTHDLTESRYAATIAAVLVTFSPVFILYSGQVMTDVPALLLLTLALIVHLRGLKQDRGWMVLAGAALLGAGVNLRETTAFFGLWLLLAPFAYGRAATCRLAAHRGVCWSCALRRFLVCLLVFSDAVIAPPGTVGGKRC